MKYYFIVGERSGDLHASNLIKQLKNQDAQADIRGLGGELMKAAGATIYRLYHEINYMGFWEVFKHLPVIFKNLKWCQQDLLQYKPDVLVLVDFGGFNMKMAKFAKQNNIKVFYYISPKIWAWNTNRAYAIKKYVDQMYVILPFEKEFYKKFDYHVQYVGNPVNDSITEFVPNPYFEKSLREVSKPIIAILPGSRVFEINNMFSEIGNFISSNPRFTYAVAAINSVPKHLYQDFKRKYPEVVLVYEQTYDLLKISSVAVVTSGTASLETALIGTPQIVVYKTNPITWWIAKMLVKISYVSLPNLIVNRAIVKELLQKDFCADKIKIHIEELLNNSEFSIFQKRGYLELKEKMGNANTAQATAIAILNDLKK